MSTTPTPLVAFHGDAQLKADLIREVRWHRKQDKIIAGVYAKGDNGDFKGCAVGCSLHSLFRVGRLKERVFNDHRLYEPLVGVPEGVARWQDRIFEGLPDEGRAFFTERFWKAIPVGADLSDVSEDFTYWLDSDAEVSRAYYALCPLPDPEEDAAYTRMADKLLELLAAAPLAPVALPAEVAP